MGAAVPEDAPDAELAVAAADASCLQLELTGAKPVRNAAYASDRLRKGFGSERRTIEPLFTARAGSVKGFQRFRLRRWLRRTAERNRRRSFRGLLRAEPADWR